MSAVEVRMVKVNNAEGTFVDPFSFEVTYEAYRELPHDLEWQIIYVGSAGSDNSEEFDQTLENVLVGPVKPGTHRFQFPAPAPDPAKIPKQELLGVTIVLLTCSYKNQEFVRIGYYVANSVPGQQVTAVPAAARGRMIGAEDDTPPPETEDGEEEDDEDEEEDDDISMEPEAEVPVPADLRLVTRRILADKPRVTKFPIDWDV